MSRAMPLCNRILPSGEIVAIPDRGTLMGNRGGRIHDPQTKTILRPWASRHWIACDLVYKGLHHEPMGQGYTSLFFLDEVTALAAGHRPCFTCRRGEAKRFLALSGIAGGVDPFDRLVHGERLVGRAKRTYHQNMDSLPDGAMILIEGAPHALRNGELLRWSPRGYEPTGKFRHAGGVEVLTPASFVEILRRGYFPRWHRSAEAGN